MDIKIFEDLLDAQIRDLNRNRDGLKAVTDEIRELETQLSIAKSRETALRAERNTGITQFMGVRAIIRKAEADATAELQATQDAELS